MQNYSQTANNEQQNYQQQNYQQQNYQQQNYQQQNYQQHYPTGQPDSIQGQPYGNYNKNNNNSMPYPPQQQGYYPIQGTEQQDYQSNGFSQNNSNLSAPPLIPASSALIRHPMSSIIAIIKKNLIQFPEDFRKKFSQNQSFRSFNRKVVFIPSICMIMYVWINHKKKWFRLTCNPTMLRWSLVSLFVLHMTNNFLYVTAYRDLVLKNRDKIQKIVIKEELLAGMDKLVA